MISWFQAFAFKRELTHDRKVAYTSAVSAFTHYEMYNGRGLVLGLARMNSFCQRFILPKEYPPL